MRSLTVDFPEQIGDELHITSDSRTVKEAVNALVSYENISPEQAFNTFDGFMYTGKVNPLLIDYYFVENQETKSRGTYYVIFSYYENKFGKDLGWSKVYSVKAPPY